jgi:hypothetical protein
MAWEIAAQIGLSALSSVLGGMGGQAEADARNEAIRRQYQYDLQSWKYGKKRVRADYRQDKKQWRLNQQNEETRAAWQDSTNLQDWQYALKIQDFEYASQMRQYRKSEELYGQQLTFNKMAMAAANEAEHRKLEDSTKELAFQNQDIVMKAMQAQGVTAVKNQQGRSAAKGEQAVMASLGRNQAILAESLLSARADTDAALRKIATDKFGADLAAQAARMLKPERAPRPPKPLTTPRAQFLKPRKPREFDFGPKPIKGAGASATPAWLGAGGQALSGIAGTVGSLGKYNTGFDFGGLSAGDAMSLMTGNPFEGFGASMIATGKI